MLLKNHGLLLVSVCLMNIQCYSKPTLDAVLGSIIDQKVDVIVNAANPLLQGGNGVCGVIFKAAGWSQLQKACNQYPLKKGIRCPVGQARITDSFLLKKNGILNIIHAVGPDARIIKDPKVQRSLLMSAYTQSLQLATEQRLTSIAFPFISSGIYAVDHQLAAQAAVTAAQNFIQGSSTSLKEIRFVLINTKDLQLFQSLLND